MIDWAAVMSDAIRQGEVGIPAAPGVALMIRGLAAGGRADEAALADLVARDEPLAAAILAVANAPDPRWSGTVSTPVEAIRRLGVAELARIVLPLATAAMLPADGPLGDLRRLTWRRSLMCAQVSRFLAERMTLPPHDAFVCGLLHDCGWMVAIAALEQHMKRHPEWHREKPLEPGQWTALVDLFHILLGHMAATRWQMEPVVAECVLYHHATDAASPQHRVMVELTALADRVVAVIESRHYVDASALAGVPGVGSYAAALAEAAPRIVAETAELLALDLGAAAPPSSKRVVFGSPPLGGRVKEVRLHAEWINGSRRVPALITSLAGDGMMAAFAEAPRANYLMKVSIASASGPIELFATAGAVEAVEHQFHARLKLVALSGALKQRWDRLYATGA